jgi:leucyl-tRNA synthetase
MKSRLEQWYEFATKHYSRNHETHAEKKEIDKWMEHQMHSCIRDATKAMDETLFRTAIMRGFFDLQRYLKWYLRRTAGKVNYDLINQIIEAQTLMLQPFTPHLCEEIWFRLKKPGFIVNQQWPAFDESKINPNIEQTEALMENVLEDVSQVLKLAKVEKPTMITLFVAKDWKVNLFRKLRELLATTRDVGEIMKAVMLEFKEHASDVAPLVQKIVKDPSKLPQSIAHQEAEFQNLMDSIAFLKQEFGCPVEIIKEQESPEAKAKQALPGKPAILVR